MLVDREELMCYSSVKSFLEEKMVKIAIVENSYADMEQLKQVLNTYSKKNNVSFSVEQYTSGESFFQDKTKEYDILFLDIMLDKMNGLEIAKCIRETDQSVIIIFVTTASGYASDGFSVNALDFVIKPIRYESFSFTLDRALRKLSQKSRIKIGIESGKGIEVLFSDEITYIEVFGHNVIYHLGKDGQSVMEWGSLSKLEELLADYGFFRCSKYFLVNMKYIEKIQGSEITVDGQELAVSPKKLPELKKRLNQYFSS